MSHAHHIGMPPLCGFLLQPLCELLLMICSSFFLNVFVVGQGTRYIAKFTWFMIVLYYCACVVPLNNDSTNRGLYIYTLAWTHNTSQCIHVYESI